MLMPPRTFCVPYRPACTTTARQVEAKLGVGKRVAGVAHEVGRLHGPAQPQFRQVEWRRYLPGLEGRVGGTDCWPPGPLPDRTGSPGDTSKTTRLRHSDGDRTRKEGRHGNGHQTRPLHLGSPHATRAGGNSRAEKSAPTP